MNGTVEATATNSHPTPIKKGKKIRFQRVFTKGGVHPFDEIVWVTKDAVLISSEGKEKFRQNNVEVPAFWNGTTTNIVAEKYFRVVGGVKENSAKQMFHRVAWCITSWAIAQGTIDGAVDGLGDKSFKGDALIFYEELIHMLVHGMFAFNSPVWFNVGVLEKPQCSACFIQEVSDEMGDIMDLAKKEVMLFKGGSGTGSNLSALRSSYEKLSGGGLASGPVSFMSGFDAFAGVTKSGGTTRRAAKMVVLNVDHPDILEQKNGDQGFITCKSHVEQVAHDLYSTGKYTAEFNVPGNVYNFLGFQNANNSVRVTDDFMKAVERDGDWVTRAVVGGEPIKTYKARDIWKEIAKAAWFCGDPGIQFDTITNEWHTSPNSGRINASNPCQPAWATVLTPTGIRTFADIGVGSLIWSGKEWTKVARKVSTGIKPVYRFYTRAGIFAGTEEHRVISNGSRVEARVAESIDTAIGHIDGYQLWDHNPQAIVDGLVFGDGYVKISNDGRDHYTLLCIGENDQSYFSDKRISEYINSAQFDKLAHRVNATLSRDELPKTYLRTVPRRYMEGGAVQVSSFLRGLYSANGSVVDGRITLKAASFSVISQVQEMLSSLGIRSYYTTNKSTDVEFANGTYTCKESYDLNITTSRGDFSRLIGFVQPYKQAKLSESLSIELPARGPKTNYDVVSKQLVGEEPVWDIEVESEEHTYWTGGLLVSNCSEYLFLDDTACNLASLNLTKFVRSNGSFNLDTYEHACAIGITAMESLVDASSYPSPTIETNSHTYRTLGLGYTNLGALLTYWGLPYDSSEGRTVAAALTAIMGGAAQKQSARLADVRGPFSAYEKNSEAMLAVVAKHASAAKRIQFTVNKDWHDLVERAPTVWAEALELGKKYGFRNAQVTVLAPTGTISFLMQADTTGLEPMLGCVVYKKLVGEGSIKMPNAIVEPALHRLGYSEEVVADILSFISNEGKIHGAPGFDNDRHGPVFAESLGDYALRAEAHVLMMGAVQPFLSGGISKTVNMPNSATVADIERIYMLSWKEGLKCVAVYRDACKLSQPISTSLSSTGLSTTLKWGERRKMPDERPARTVKLTIGGTELYVTPGFFEDGSLGEIFVRVAKQGSTLNGIIDAWATTFSIGLQHGVPLVTLLEKCSDQEFEPKGYTNHPVIRRAKSIVDLVAQWLALKYAPETAKHIIRFRDADLVIEAQEVKEDRPQLAAHGLGDGPPCSRCGNMTKRSGSCYTCTSCGTTSGCG